VPYRYRAFAIDYDGTLTASDEPARDTLAAVAEARRSGRRVVLVTGRIMEELLAVFPDVRDHFDSIVAENGGVLYTAGDPGRMLAPQIAPELAGRLLGRGVPFRSGSVLLASQVAHGATILEEIEALGLEVQLVRNRNELMVLPSGCNKGTGVIEALAELGVDRHNAVAFGDAENDHTLLLACEVGVAVGNAVDSLKAHADVVLSQPGGAGVAAFLRRVLHGEVALVQPARWQAELGVYDDGTPVRVPAAAAAIGIFGGSGAGKSLLAGLLAERVLRLGYRTCIIDPEGDHQGLAELPGVVGVGGANALPAVADVISILGDASVVADMALHDECARVDYARQLVAACLTSREETGLPHCVIVDEAHTVFGPAGVLGPLAISAGGVCLVTYRPDLLADLAHARLDYRVTVVSATEAMIETPGTEPRRFRIAERQSRHRRHARKYSSSLLPVHRRFHFRSNGTPTGRTASSLREFRDELVHATDGVLGHHAARHDFSRWLADLCRDRDLARAVQAIETHLAKRQTPAAAARFREELLGMLGTRYSL
jgi:hydroxymethylpyrimidine pyrophosphatase-like HAD family hydrolase